MEEYKRNLLAMLTEKGFEFSPYTHDEIQSLFYNCTSLEDAVWMAYDVYTGTVDDIETEEDDLAFLDSLCEDGLMP
jgi:hypothetical protein